MITEIVYFKREGDEALISKMMSNLEKMSEDELVNEYNNIAKRGLIAAHGQALYLFSMRRAFLIKLGASPIDLINSCVLSITPNKVVTAEELHEIASTPSDYDLEMFSRLRREVRAFGKMKSQELIDWWNYEY